QELSMSTSVCLILCVFSSFFFFQAEDGIRDRNVTGVQTCALPILQEEDFALELAAHPMPLGKALYSSFTGISPVAAEEVCWLARSEERRVGKECGCRSSRYQ